MESALRAGDVHEVLSCAIVRARLLEDFSFFFGISPSPGAMSAFMLHVSM